MAYDSEASLDPMQKLAARTMTVSTRKPLITVKGLYVTACLALVVLAAWGVRP